MPTDPTKTLMLVGAHHDDNEGGASTAIVRHRQAGWRVVSVVMTNGRWMRGSFKEEHIAVRDEESRQAAKVLDMETVFMRFDEAGFRATKEACDALVEKMLEYRPDVVITHPPRDYHFDHVQTSQCTLEATELCGMALHTTPGMLRPPRLYYCDAFYLPFEPDVYVDATDYMDIKAEAQRCHRSQLPAESPNDGGIVELARTRARYRGVEAGVEYAEAYRFVPRLASARVAELLT
ncbi:MAG: hypothetical protein CMJ18_12645 [Phycisphaeraceae bacterium]|nr:hypothetical protein [Phycisphaeraceae bacterium]